MHEFLSSFAQSWGMLYMIALFVAGVAYALWPSNRATFERAAKAPLASEDDDGDQS